MSIFTYLEKLTRTEMAITTMNKAMTRGETWVCPVRLKKNGQYSVSAICSGRGIVSCALYNGDAKMAVAESSIGKQVSFSIAPDKDGLYSLRAVLASGSDGMHERVTVAVRKSYLPNRIRAWGDFE